MAKYIFRVFKEDGSIDNVVTTGESLESARDELMALPDVIDAQYLKNVVADTTGRSIAEGIDQYVGTEQDLKDLVGL